MKKVAFQRLVIALTALTITIPLNSALGFSQEWNYTYLPQNTGNLLNLVKTSDSGFVLLCIEPYPSGSLERNYSLIKLDAYGRQEWNKTFNLHGDSSLSSVIQTSDSGYVLGGGKDFSTYGEKYSTNNRGLDFWLIKTDRLGNIVWNKTYGEYWHESPSSVVETSDKGYVLGGYTWSYGNSLWLIKTDANGALQWNHTYAGNYLTNLIKSSDQGFAFTSNPGELTKTDENGSIEWKANLYVDYSATTEPTRLIHTSDGGYAVICHAYTGYWNTVYYSLTKVDANGSIQWRQEYPDCHINAFLELSTGEFCMAGYIFKNGTVPWIARTNSSGFLIWNGTLSNNLGSISSIFEIGSTFVIFGTSNNSIWQATSANENTPSSSPQTDTPLLFALAGIISILVIALLVVFLKRKRTKKAPVEHIAVL